MTDVSVVMSVYNEPEHTRQTIESVLAQKEIDFEFIIVSDGASDAVLKVVDQYESDARIKLFKQANQGLTRGLIVGCELAKSNYIARIDAGDEMLESRLKKQFDLLESDQELGFVSSLCPAGIMRRGEAAPKA